MKKILVTIVFVFFILSVNAVHAKNNSKNLPSIKYNGAKYTLYYSEKSKELGGFINEYYKQRENYTNWTELIALHHYPDAFYPIEHAKEFKEYLSDNGCKALLDEDNKNNTAILDFTIINSNRLPIILEYNIFKYVKSPVCGTLGLQYAKRYRINNALEVNKVISSINKTRKKQITIFKKTKVPKLITESIDKGIYVKEEKNVEKQEKQTEENITEVKLEDITEEIKQEPSKSEETPEQKVEGNITPEETSDKNCNIPDEEQKNEQEQAVDISEE